MLTRREFLKSAAVFALGLALPSEVLAMAKSKPKPHLEEIMDNVFHLRFAEKTDMNETFIRFAAFSQYCDFKGKIPFTAEEVRNWYYEKRGKDNYDTVSGRNVPGASFLPFYDGRFNPLSDEEKYLLNLFSHKKDEKFYVIATSAKTSGFKEHEIAHALFYMNEGYRKEVMDILKTENPLYLAEMDFLEKVYHPDYIKDEIQASSLNQSKKIRRVFDKYYKPLR